MWSYMHIGGFLLTKGLIRVHLPIPAGQPAPSVAHLPIPAEMPVLDPKGLPIPARATQNSAEDNAEAATLEMPTERLLQIGLRVSIVSRLSAALFRGRRDAGREHP